MGFPRCRKVPRRRSKRPEAPGKDASAMRGASPARNAASPSASAPRPISRSAGCAEQALPRAVRELQGRGRVEGEDRDVDLLHHLPEESGRLEGAEPLLAQGLGERVHLGERLPEGVVAPPHPGAEREVLLAQRAEEVRERLQRPGHRLARGRGQGEPGEDDEDAERPLRPRREVAAEEEDAGEDEGREPGAEGEELDAAVVREPAAAARRGGHPARPAARARTAAGGGRGRCARGRAPRPRG